MFLAVIILIGGMAALYWGKSVQDATAPVEVVEEPVEPAPEELAAGSQLVFQVDEERFYRLAVDDVSAEPFLFATIDHPPTISGGLVAYVYGQDLLLHRYQADDQDGVLSLDGEILETRAKQWGTIRSANGRYEVSWTPEGDVADVITVMDLADETSLLEIDAADIKSDSDRWYIEPFLVDDQGAFFYARETCGCEATLSGLWMIEVATGEVTRLDDLVDLDSWFLSNLDVQTRGLLAISTEREPSQDGPYEELLPPTTIRILDLESLEVGELLVDEVRAWDRPWLDPEGNDRYVVRIWDEGNKLYLVNFDDTEITEENFLTDGWVLDWVGDWLVVRNTQDSTLKLVNVESKEEVILEIPGERVDYVGSIKLK